MPDLIYRHNILDHYQTPRRFREIKGATYKIGASNPLCGDGLVLYVRANGDKIEDISFEGQGCAISQSAASMLMEKIVDEKLTLPQILKIRPKDIYELLGVPISPAREKCALLVLTAIKGVFGMSPKDRFAVKT